MREPIELERRVAVTIWRLATNVEYRILGELFGLGRSTVGKIILETCEATYCIASSAGACALSTDQTLKQVIVVLMPSLVLMPNEVAGAIDGTHIPCIRPQANATDWFNRF